MTTSRKIVIKINQSSVHDTTNISNAQPKEAMDWNWRRIIIAVVITISLLVLLVNLIFNGSTQDKSTGEISTTTNIIPSNLLPSNNAENKEIMIPPKLMQLKAANAKSNTAKVSLEQRARVIEKLKASAKPQQQNNKHIKSK